MKVEIGKKYEGKWDMSKDLHEILVVTETQVVSSSKGHLYLWVRSIAEQNLAEVSPYNHIQIDDKVLVWDRDDEVKRKRHFAGISAEGQPRAYEDGGTSWSSSGTGLIWSHCEKVTE